MPAFALKDAVFYRKMGLFTAKYMHTFVYSVITYCYIACYACT